MATNQDFDDLIVRIEDATETLEADVLTITGGVGDLAQAVTDAEGYATAASDSATDANQSYLDAQALVTDLENAVIIEEAPEDGNDYARNNGAWVEITAGGGAVDSVNGETGVVVLDASDVGALADTYVPAWTDVTGKPSFATVATTGSYNDLSDTPTIPTFGTVASEDVVTGTGDTTTDHIPTVQWVETNAGGDVTVSGTAVQNGLCVFQVNGGKAIRNAPFASTNGEIVRLNTNGAASSSTPAELKTDLDLGTAADEDVVTGTGDTTGSNLTTVDWVNANAGGSGGGPLLSGTSGQLAAAGVSCYYASDSGSTFADIVSHLESNGLEFGCSFNFVNIALATGLPQGGRANISICPVYDGGVIDEINYVLQYASSTESGNTYRARRANDSASSWTQL